MLPVSRTASALLKSSGSSGAAPGANLAPASLPALLPSALSGPTGPSPVLDQAVALTAQAKLALQRGDVASAKQLIDRAVGLKVADSQFGPGQLRPWQVSMDIDNAMRLRDNPGVTQAAAMIPTGNQQAGGPNAARNSGSLSDKNNSVQSGVYQPQNDPSRVAQAGSLSPMSAINQDLSANELYEKGLQAMSQGNRDQALQYFSGAWKKQDQLDANIRTQLKDKLTFLQSRNSGENISAVPAERNEATQRKQRLFAEVSGELADSERMVNERPNEALDRLRNLRNRVGQADVDGAYRKQMLAMVDKVTNNVEAWVEQNKAQIDLDQRNRQIEDRMSLEAVKTVKDDLQIQTLVDQYNELMESCRYAEAEVIAKKVEEIKPNSEIAVVMGSRAKIQRRIAEDSEIRSMKERRISGAFTDIDRAASSLLADNRPMEFGSEKEWTEISRRRAKYGDQAIKLLPSERRILELLEEPFSASFERRPLSDALKTISEMTGLLINIDEPSIAEEGLRSDQPISLDLRGNQIKLKSVLKNILEPLNLSYAVRNESLWIQSRRFLKQDMYTQPYGVKDLVIPVPNFVSDYNTGMAGALQSAYQAQTSMIAVNLEDQSSVSLDGRRKIASLDSNSNILAQYGAGQATAPSNLSPGMAMTNGGSSIFPGTSNSMGGAALANFNELMRLIESTITPDVWANGGGSSTMMPFRGTLSLIINAPQETHEQIADLLKSLRALQNLQVSIEVRFITLQDTFFEKLGVDFDMNVDDKVRRLPREDSGPSVVVGLSSQTTTVPTLTGDFDLQLRNGSFGVNPPFGNPDLNAGSSLGLAILSDLELFFFLQAAQGNSRQNVLQAPRVTMFDGQIGTINDTAQRPFVIGFDPVVGDFAVAQRPIIVVLGEGTQMNVQSVVSPDKRFVRLTLVPQFTRLESTDRVFTFTGRTTTRTGTNILNQNGNPTNNRNNEENITEGTTVQQPTFGITSVSTTVSVPDGGTILMGGIKRLREGRTERGTPILSKIPYINRLFKNNAIGRETSTLMMTVTPRIIIPAEEEEALGIAPPRP